MTSSMARTTSIIAVLISIVSFFLVFFSVEIDGVAYSATGLQMAFGFELGFPFRDDGNILRLTYLLCPLLILGLWLSKVPRRRQFHIAALIGVFNSFWLILLRTRILNAARAFDSELMPTTDIGWMFCLAPMFTCIIICYFGCTALDREESGRPRQVTLRREPWLAVDPEQPPEEWGPIYIRDPKDPRVNLRVTHPWDIRQQEKEQRKAARKAARAAALNGAAEPPALADGAETPPPDSSEQ